MSTISKQQYIANWHDFFVEFIGCMYGVLAELMAKQDAMVDDKRGLDDIKLILFGWDVAD